MILNLHKPNNTLSGVVNLPGSKSISNRLLIIQALSGLSFSIRNLSHSDDTKHLQQALQQIKAKSPLPIDIEHAGTDMRFLSSILASTNADWCLTGSERMQQRPIKELVDVLKQLEADISYTHNEGFPPLQIKGAPIKGGSVSINGGISSQYISSLLLVAPYFTEGLTLKLTHDVVSSPYIVMTIELMKTFGAEVTWNHHLITVKPKPYSYNQTEYVVESDWSAASYFYSIVALSPINTTITLRFLFQDSLQADALSVSIYKQFGVNTMYNHNEVVLKKQETTLSYFRYDFLECPDIAQTVACTCLGLNIPFDLTGLQTLKVKETDRLIALKHEAHKFGFALEINAHSMSYQHALPVKQATTTTVATYSDHRMAMAFAPLCVIYNAVLIEDAEVVSKSYPTFWNDLNAIGISFDRL